MQKEILGWIPEEESLEETLCWFVDPTYAIHAKKKDALYQWGKIKQIRIKIELEEIVAEDDFYAERSNTDSSMVVESKGICPKPTGATCAKSTATFIPSPKKQHFPRKMVVRRFKPSHQ